MSAGVGITGFGAYVPRRRLSRQAVVEAMSWLAPALKSQGSGSRCFAGWDEDTVTMAVQACRHCLGPARERTRIGALLLASTTPVFLDRLNAGIVATALALDEQVAASDLTGTRRAGTTGLLLALDGVAARRDAKSALVVATERRLARAGSPQELAYGDAAACIEVGHERVIAHLRGRHSLTVDFVDRFRAAGARYEYLWEERWSRDEGYAGFVPAAIGAVLRDAGLQAGDIDRVVLPCPHRGLAARLAVQCGIRADVPIHDAEPDCGDLGAAHALVLLAAALERCQPGEKVLLADFGQGCEAAVFEVTPAITGFRPERTFAEQVAAGVCENQYLRFLTMRGLVDWEKGPRAEKDPRTSLTTLYRHRRMLLALVGGRDRRTGEVQFPATRMAVSESGAALDTLDPYPLADRLGTVLSWSADHMAVTPDPPNHYGMVTFPEGGRLMMDFADVLGAEVATGMPMRMVFRIKDHDAQRDYTRYFWKAAPL